MMLKAPRDRDKAYLAALHRVPCLICGAHGVEAAHVRLTSIEWAQRTGIRTGAGGAEKPSDMWCLPLCVKHHRVGPDAEHSMGTVAFWRKHQLDPHAIAHALYSASPNIEAMASIIARVQYFGAYRVENN